MNTTPNTQFQALQTIARNAGDIVRQGFYASKDITHKGTVDLVTQYDIATERHLLAQLQPIFNDYTLIGEETHQGTFNQTPARALYIDPIDGTTNFVHGVPHCAISIGVYHHTQAIMAVVYNPILDELYAAHAGHGAHLTQNGHTHPLHTSPQTDLQQALIATGFPYTKVNTGPDYHWIMRALGLTLPRTRDIRRLGSAALDLCYVAKGSFDAYYEINLKPWDWAAGALIAQEAGATLTNTHGGATSFTDNSLIAAPAPIHHALLELLKQAETTEH